MASRRSRPRRFLLPTILAAVLAAEITGLALARTLAPSASPVDGGASVSASAAAAAGGLSSADAATAADAASAADAARAPGSTRTDSEGTRPSGLIGVTPAVNRATVAHTAQGSSGRAGGSSAGGSAGGSASSAAYRGTNHVWIPSLGINKGIQSFPCSRTRPPDAGVYRWGCAGTNNVYLLGHAWSTFKPLHDAYVGGRLRKGMHVIYADGAGRVHTYAVIWWKVVAPTTAASWAWASLSTPSMTLQTCVGSQSQYRLMVRLTRVA